jgi:NADH:ubiquinone oxidoreductase subunit F (NADH-binding)/NADH:ubiquinone oxidoreductase subunit E
VFEELRAVQRQFGYLPADQLHALSAKLKIPVSQIHAVASFYPHFNLAPPPKVDVRICADMSCHLRGACELREDLKRAYQGAPESEITIRDTSCLGRCDSAPALSVNDTIYSGITREKTLDMVRSATSGRGLPPAPVNRVRAILATDPYKGAGEYAGVRRLVESQDFLGTIATLKASGLRGLGGAGFPTGLKWEIVRNAPGKKYIVCNADESEPGTIKDRFIMEQMPHLVIEGMILAGLVTGAKTGIIYIRHEYEEPKEALQQEIDRCYAIGVLGPHVMGGQSAFDLSIFVSPGGYICGEESALLEAIEGRRAEPRNKPPFPGTNGLYNLPTAINNVETFTFAAAILVRGVDWYKAQGLNGIAGLKFVGVSGDVERPGVFEVPMGTSYSDLIYRYARGVSGNRKLLGFAPSGPSSGYLPASMVTLPLDFNAVAAVGSMVGSGAIVVCADGRCMLDMALNAVRFFRNESCGKCVPCRVGSQKMVSLLTNWTTGKSLASDRQTLDDLTQAMRMSSICGLGQIVHAPIASVLKHFPDVIEDHLERRHCSAGVCFQEQA